MTQNSNHARTKKKLILKESLFLGFCAVLIIVTRAALRLHLHLPGHSMFFLVFFLLLARGCVPYLFSASFTGLMAGLMAMTLGMGKGGPLLIIKFILPAVVIDAGAWIMPLLFENYILCAIIAAVAASTKIIDTYVIDVLIGADKTIGFQHAVITSSPGILFGMAGSFFIPPVIKKLKAHGIIGDGHEDIHKL